MTTYTADDFKNARFAEHPESGRIAARLLANKKWAWTAGRNEDRLRDDEMAGGGWVPVPAGSYTRTDEPADPDSDDTRTREHLLAEEHRLRGLEKSLRAHLSRTINRAEKAERAAQTLGKVIEDQCRDIARITRSERMVDADGDADWGAIWERGHELADRLEKAEKERDEAREARDLWVTRSDQWERAEQRAVEQRNAALSELADYEPRPLTPDDITDEMVKRGVEKFRTLPTGMSAHARVSIILTAALTEPPARPEGAEEIHRVLDAIYQDEPGITHRGNLADTLATYGVRVTGAES